MPKNMYKLTPFIKQCFVTCAVCCDVIGHGCIIGYVAVVLPQLSAKDASIALTEAEASWIASTLGLAIMIGIVVTPPIMGQLGRKRAHYIVIITLMLGWLLFAIATTVWELIIGRILQGLSFGIFMPLRSILIGEYSSPKYRGGFLTTIALSQAFGIMLVHLIGALLSWQRTAMACVLFSFVSFVMTVFSPESPSWLADKGRYDECRKVFIWLRGVEEEKELDELIKARLDAKPAEKMQRKNHLLTMVLKKEFYKPVLLMFHVYCMMIISGGATLASFIKLIIGDVIGPNVDANFWMVFFDTQRLVSNVVAIYVINKTRRRTMMFGTLGLCIATHLAIAGYSFAREKGVVDLPWIPITLINVHYFTIATGMIPLPGVLAGELFPLEFRSAGGSISMISYAAFLFISLKTFMQLMNALGLYGTYLVYSGILVYTFVVLWYIMPETKGKTLQEIEDEYKGKSKLDIEMEAYPLNSGTKS